MLTDGVGGIQLIVGPLLSGSRRESNAPRAAGAAGANGMAPSAALPSPATLLRGRSARRGAQRAGRRGALARAAGSVLSDPVGSIRSAANGAMSLARYLLPAAGPLSPVMTGRSRAVHFASFSVPLAELKDASHAAGGTLNAG